MNYKKALKTKRSLLRLLDKVVDASSPQYDAVYVQWRDARSVACAWTPVEQVKVDGALDPIIHTCGWLIQETKSYILVGISVDDLDGNSCDMVLKVPRENVVRIQRLMQVKLKHG